MNEPKLKIIMSEEFNLPTKISKHETKPTYYVLDSKDFLVCSILDESEAIKVSHAINLFDDMYKELEAHLASWENLYPSDMPEPFDQCHIDEFKAVHGLISQTKALMSKARGE